MTTRRRSETLPSLPPDWRVRLDTWEAWRNSVPGLTGVYAERAWRAAWDAACAHYEIERKTP